MPRPVQLAIGAASKKAIFKPEHQSCEPVDDKPRYYYINPLQAPVGIWQGSSQYVDFEIPQEMGVLQSMQLRFQISFPDTTPAHLPSLPPTPYWLSRVETYLGSDLVETVYADTIWHENIAFLREQDAHDVADVYNINISDLSPRNLYTPASYAAAVAGTGATVANPNQPGAITQTSSGFYYVSLDCTALKAMKPYVRGFQSKFRVRVYFPTSVVAQLAENTPYAAGPPAVPATFWPNTPSVSFLQVVAEEQQTDPASLARLEAAHKAGVVDYTIAIRERLQDNPSTLVGGQQYTTFLRAFRNKSAGLITYITQPNPSNDQLAQRLAFKSFQLLDSRGNKLTEILDNDFLTSYVFPTQIDSSFPNSANADIRTIVLLPFANAFQPVIEKGCSYGNMQMTSLEQLVLTPDGTQSTTPGTVNPNGETTCVGQNMITVVSYSYGHITCVAGKHSIRFEQ